MPITPINPDELARARKVAKLRSTVRRLNAAAVALSWLGSQPPEDHADIIMEHDRAQADYNRACDALKV